MPQILIITKTYFIFVNCTHIMGRVGNCAVVHFFGIQVLTFSIVNRDHVQIPNNTVTKQYPKYMGNWKWSPTYLLSWSLIWLTSWKWKHMDQHEVECYNEGDNLGIGSLHLKSCRQIHNTAEIGNVNTAKTTVKFLMVDFVKRMNCPRQVVHMYKHVNRLQTRQITRRFSWLEAYVKTKGSSSIKNAKLEKRRQLQKQIWN